MYFKKFLLAAHLLSAVVMVKAQPIYLSKNSFDTEVTTKATIKTLSSDFLKKADLSSKNPQVISGNILLAIGSNDYMQGEKIIDSFQIMLIRDYGPAYGGSGAVFKSYFITQRLISEGDTRGFAEIFSQQFTRIYNTLSKEAAALLDIYANQDPVKLKENLDNQINDFKSANSDTLSSPNAKRLALTGSQYFFYNAIVPLLKPLLNQLNDHNFIIQDSILIKTADGAEVSLTIVIPKTDKPMPCVLMMNIYAGRDLVLAKTIATRGYVGVIANTRGKRLSKNDLFPFKYENTDVYDVIDWISKQQWSNQKVGMYGGSYLGFSQWAALKKRHPALKTIVPQVAVAIGVDFPVSNGMFLPYTLQWIHYVENNKLTDPQEFLSSRWPKLYNKWYQSGLPFNKLDSLDGRPNKIFQEWLKHPTHDKYWQSLVPYKTDFRTIDLPILSITGYYDPEQYGALYYFRQHYQFNKNANHYLVIGPYDHAGAQAFPAPVLGGYALDSVAQINIEKLVFDWFDYTLKDGAKPDLLKNVVNYQVMGLNEWRHVSRLSDLNLSVKNYFFTAHKEKGYFALSEVAATKPAFIQQIIDLKDRTDTLPVENLQMIQPVITDTLPFSQKISIAFSTAPFTAENVICGPIKINAVLAINKKDVDITASVYELLPDGKFQLLSVGWQRASHAYGREKRKLLAPNQITNVPVQTFITSKKIQKGSRLIFVLGVAKGPNFQLNYGTGKDVSTESIKDAETPLIIKWYEKSNVSIPFEQ